MCVTVRDAYFIDDLCCCWWWFVCLHLSFPFSINLHLFHNQGLEHTLFKLKLDWFFFFFSVEVCLWLLKQIEVSGENRQRTWTLWCVIKDFFFQQLAYNSCLINLQLTVKSADEISFFLFNLYIVRSYYWTAPNMLPDCKELPKTL